LEYPREQAGSGWNPSEKVRLFPNDNRIRFENAVHELVEPSLRRAGIPIFKCSIPVHHYGMLNRYWQAQKKGNYYSLGKAKLAKKQGDLSALVECAIQAAEVGKYTEAVGLWQHILKSKPNWPKAHFNLSYAYIQLENYREGEAAAREAIRLDPNLKEARLNYALCLMRLGQNETAIEYLERCRIEDPDHPMALGLLAVARVVQGNTDNGVKLLRELKAMGFDCPAYILDHARKFLGAGRTQPALSLLTFADKTGFGGAEITVLLNRLSPVQVGTDRLIIHVFDLTRHCPEFSHKLHALKDFTPAESRQFAVSDTIRGSDFVVFPFSIDPLYHQLGRNELLRFLAHLEGFKENEHKFVFFLVDDISSALGLQSVIFRVNHDVRRTDTNSITLPYFVEDIFAEPAQQEMRYHVNFVGTVVTHLIRAYMLLPFLQQAELTRFGTMLATLQRLLQQRRNQAQYDAGLTDAMGDVRKLFPIDPVIDGIRYFFDISVDQFPRLPEQMQKERKARLVDLINQSMTTLCPRGFGVQSIRFFETLSAGRIPILISNHYRLPLEGQIDYSGFIWKIDEDKILELSSEIETLFKTFTDRELIERANTARQTWQQYFAPSRRGEFMYLNLRDVLKKDYCLNG
jgi:tetratricopeptide (TPR) repeat protein